MSDLPDVVETGRGATVERAGPELLQRLLEVLERELVAAGAPQGLNPPRPERELRDAFSSIGLAIPDELAVLFRWHDGHSSAGPTLIPMFPFDSASNSIHAYRVVTPVFAEMALEEGLAPTETADYDWGAGVGWLRLWRDNYTAAVDCTGDPHGSPLVRLTSPDFPFSDPAEHQVVSLCTPIALIIEGLRAGAHFWDPKTGRWGLDVDRLPPLHRKYWFM